MNSSLVEKLRRSPRLCRGVGCIIVLAALLLVACNSGDRQNEDTGEAALVAQKTIEAALAMPPATAEETPTPTPVEVTQPATPTPAETPNATATQRAMTQMVATFVAATTTGQARMAAQERATAAARATAQAMQTADAVRATRAAQINATATENALNEMVAAIVAATATEQARIAARERAAAASVAATQAAQIAATATEQARMIDNANATAAALAATQSAQIAANATAQALMTEAAAIYSMMTAEAAHATLTAQAMPSPNLLDELRTRLSRARVVNRYPERADRLIVAVIGRLDEFVAPGYGVSRDDFTAALFNPGAEDRLNALVDNVWFEWEEDAPRLGLDAYNSDPDRPNISPLRKLIIRLIQGTQGWISEQQAYAFYNFLTRHEEDHVWFDYVNGVIGAVNREVFNWP